MIQHIINLGEESKCHVSAGVQFFGELNFHCVRNEVESAEEVTIDDLTIPDSYCNPKKGSGGHQCPNGRKLRAGCRP